MSDGTCSDYLAWNDAIASRLFNSDQAGRPVYLFVTQEFLADVGQQLGQSPDEFIATVRAGPPGATRSGHCQRALQVADGWRGLGFVYPPYIAYLALFVLAAGHEGDFDPRDYYPRLWDLLGEPRSGTPSSFDRMWELWEDLAQWSMHDRHEDLGVFEARIVGGKDLIGFPLAQTVLTEAERRALPEIFATAGLEPGTVPAGRELRRALVVRGRATLRRPTVAALERIGDGFADAILDVAADSFVEWDGRISEPAGGPGRATLQVTAGLRLCLAIDRVARRATVVVRCHSQRELPSDGLTLEGAPVGETTCTAYLPRWSAPLSAAGNDPTASFTPDLAAWDSGLILTDARQTWTLRLRPARVRIFVDGAAEQLPGLIEILEVPRLRSFYLAFAEAAKPAIAPWLQSECDGWQEIDFAAGLPGSWTFGTVRAAATDRGPREADDALGFPERRTLQLLGGIRAGAGNTFFPFAPPRVRIAGAMPGDTVHCNGQELSSSSSSEEVYELPSDLPVDARIGLEVKQGDEVVKRRSLYLVSGAGWHLDPPLVARDEYGAASDAGAIAGAQAPESRAIFEPDLLRTPGLDGSAARVYFIGQIAGQISAWPAEPLPLWGTTWAVPLGRRGKALYCGTSIGAEAPREADSADRDRLRIWHDVLWHRRARISEPPEAVLRSLWRQYVEAAHD